MGPGEISTLPPATNNHHESAYPLLDRLTTPPSMGELFPDSMSSALDSVLPKEESKTFWKGVNDWMGWLGSLIGISNQSATAAESTSEGISVQSIKSTSIPKLEAPKPLDQEQLAKAILEINEEIARQEEEAQALFEELSTLDSSRLDTRIFQEQIARSMAQKALREADNADRQEDSLEEQRQIQQLQAQYYDLKKVIAEYESKQPILKWINYGTTGATVGVLAATFATAGMGGILHVATGLLALSKAALTAYQAALKKSNSKIMGDLFVVRHEMDEHTTGIKMNLSDMRTFNAEIAKILKAIRENLDNINETMKTVNRL